MNQLETGIIVSIGIIISIYIISYVVTFIKNKIKNHKEIGTDAQDNLIPQEELQTLKQIFYLVMATLLLANVINIIFYMHIEFNELLMMDVFVSTVVCVALYERENKLILLALMPIATIYALYIPKNSSNILFFIVFFIQLIHIFIDIYFIKYFYKNFIKYTRDKGIGYTAVLLFVIIIIAFVLTCLSESVGVLDSVVMISNAFTSNGYTVLGNSVIGKFSNIFLVWSGYILSGIGTATLAVALMNRKFKGNAENFEQRIKIQDNLIEEQKQTNEELKQLINNQNQINNDLKCLIEKQNEILNQEK
ncbi:hypothetical protein SAMN02910297_00492 [Methanobrevibacter olleyae]|uniref:Uncharacterized protein n=1 Tax=Methanobrevibacter olleyae TaxID=294671 RepID=A0A1I4GHW8_METOL|nr:hypothetical protein [Methanobrevibacter olleyae]SFL29662.1 hypothetical protein SAMN02910297_00492 [Methanobrevibacter olleyae]